MKISKIIVILVALCLVSTLSLSCASEPDSAVPENQIVTVERGNLIIDITAAGNLALSCKEDLAFEISGTVEEVSVEEGDVVEEGQVLAKLDTSEWEEQLSMLEDQVTAAERQLTAKQRDLLQAEINLRNAEIALETAEGTYEWPELEIAEADVEEAEANLQYALDRAAEAGGSSWDRVVQRYEAILDAAEKRLNAMLAGADPEEVAIKKLQLQLAEGRLDDAQKAIEDAQEGVEDAQEALEEALEDSPEIIAPFTGFITKVNVAGGDEVLKGTVAVVIADPNKFEADIMVSEMDIFQVRLEGEAYVQVDAMSGLTLPAKVTHISPTAIIQQGVVNYRVKVEIQSLESIVQEGQETRQEAMQRMQQGELPERLKQAIEEGRITREQAEEMMRQMQQGQGGQQGQMPTMVPENFQLREGLTVTVSIIVYERSNVLLVPNGAIIREGTETYVQVVSPDGVIEQRLVKTGLSDWQFTEVTEGLSEGEQVIVAGTGATTTPTAPQQRPRLPFMPGGGGPH